MKTTAAPRLAAYAALGGLALLLALLLGRPEPAALGIPLLAAVVGGLLLAERPALETSVELRPDQVVEGDEVELTLEMRSRGEVPWLNVAVPLPAGLAPADPRAPVTWRLQAGGRRVLAVRLVARRWGVHRVGRVLVRARDGLGLLAYDAEVRCERIVRAYPRQEHLLRPVRPAETQVFAGNEVSRQTGDGIEFADVREFLAGDRLRRVNWRLSAREGRLHVNELHPERNADVVLFLDSFADLRGGGGSTLETAVRAAASLTTHYLARRDRVGLIGFGGTLRWLVPASGTVQLHRVTEALLDTQAVLSYAWKGVEVIPPRTLPPRALVVALTPLLDRRVVDALLDLRGRGFDLAVVEVSPEPFTSPRDSAEERLAYRVWRLQREALRHRYLSAGVAVAAWREEEPLAVTMEEVERFRRSARTRRG